MAAILLALSIDSATAKVRHAWRAATSHIASTRTVQRVRPAIRTKVLTLLAGLSLDSAAGEAPVYLSREAVLCIALTVYHEARGISPLGQQAVAAVVLNRARTWGRGVCDVVFETRDEIPQFSWLLLSPRRLVPREPAAWLAAQRIALVMLRDEPPDPSRGALYFFNAAQVRPVWYRAKQVTLRVGSTLFLR